MTGEWVMCIGGPAHGDVYRVQRNLAVLVVPKAVGPLFCPDDQDPITHRAPRLDYDRYYEQRLFTPDRWVQTAYVHESIKEPWRPGVITEQVIVQAIMEPWRALHRQPD